MQITAILNVHDNIPLVKDTIESILAWMTKDILMVVDDYAWPLFASEQWPVKLLRGFYHNYPRSPYRNIVYGLSTALKNFPSADWYCTLDYDALVCSSSFREDLFWAERGGYWLVGCDLRRRVERFPMVEDILGTTFNDIFSFLGAVLFYNGDFVRKGAKFWEKFLYYTNDFRDGFFPDFEGYDLVEHMMPTLANHWGGKLGQLSAFMPWEEWAGNSDRYPIRWKPDITEVSKDCSIVHPLKTVDHPIRLKGKEKRQRAGKYSFPS